MYKLFIIAIENSKPGLNFKNQLLAYRIIKPQCLLVDKTMDIVEHIAKRLINNNKNIAYLIANN